MTEPREVAECANCHGSIPRGQGVAFGGRRLCPACAPQFSIAELVSAIECSKCHLLVKRPEWKLSARGYPICPFCAGVPGPDSAAAWAATVETPQIGFLVVAWLLAVVGGGILIGALAYGSGHDSDPLITAGLALSGILWFVLAAFLSLGRKILLCLEDLAKAPKPPKS